MNRSEAQPLPSEEKERDRLPPTETFEIPAAIRERSEMPTRGGGRGAGDGERERKRETRQHEEAVLFDARARIQETGRARVRERLQSEEFARLSGAFHRAQTPKEQDTIVDRIIALPEEVEFITDMEMAGRDYKESTSAEPGGIIDMTRYKKQKTTEQVPVVVGQKKERWWKRWFGRRA